jgi:importin subunit alpha-1
VLGCCVLELISFFTCAPRVIKNATLAGSSEDIDVIVKAGTIQVICSVLGDDDAHDDKILDTLQGILYAGDAAAAAAAAADETNPYAQILSECGGLDKLEELQTHHVQAIAQKAISLFETYSN